MQKKLGSLGKWISPGVIAGGLALGALGVGASGCGDDTATPTKDFTITLDMSMPADLNMETTTAQLHGDFHDYAINQILLPTKNTDFALDLDGDGTPDNQLGTIIGIL